ncbi:hypothetical protein DFH07DRAFT_810886 [Mycena maculata]|uniref:Uncharacterized protein n=1 Tax=Mycena maculata TaxID=230809 RepID=A0AAD7JII8_9AGAR|nr:hypothetical protein DFH07DRAFT_810886 [Mycena maculata]
MFRLISSTVTRKQGFRLTLRSLHGNAPRGRAGLVRTFDFIQAAPPPTLTPPSEPAPEILLGGRESSPITIAAQRGDKGIEGALIVNGDAVTRMLLRFALLFACLIFSSWNSIFQITTHLLQVPIASKRSLFALNTPLELMQHIVDGTPDLEALDNDAIADHLTALTAACLPPELRQGVAQKISLLRAEGDGGRAIIEETCKKLHAVLKDKAPHSDKLEKMSSVLMIINSFAPLKITKP